MAAAQQQRNSVASVTSPESSPSLSDRVVLSDRVMTCAACSRVLQVNDGGHLPLHLRPAITPGVPNSVECVGSYTSAHPHRMLPEARLTFIEFVDEPHNGNQREPHLDRNLHMIADAISFLCVWLGPQGAPMDQASLIRVAGHANNLQNGALHLLNLRATDRVDGQRRFGLLE